ncbi:hypothetical protein Z043_112432, partial [Scleropages formosus]
TNDFSWTPVTLKLLSAYQQLTLSEELTSVHYSFRRKTAPWGIIVGATAKVWIWAASPPAGSAWPEALSGGQGTLWFVLRRVSTPLLCRTMSTALGHPQRCVSVYRSILSGSGCYCTTTGMKFPSWTWPKGHPSTLSETNSQKK